MQLKAQSKSDVGRAREHNEDHVSIEDDLGLFVVCDGMGGHASGEVASAIAANTVRERVRAELGAVDPNAPPLDEAGSNRVAAALKAAVEAANAAVHAFGKQGGGARSAGTTCTALCVRGGRGVLAHVGDTRLYLRRSGEVHQLTFDHSFLSEAIRRGVPREEAEQHFPPNLLSRAVGPLQRVQVDTLEFDVLPGDTYLLCSDGFHGYLTERATLAPMLDGELGAVADGLVAFANERGGADNISVLLLRVEDDASEEPERLSRVHEDLTALQAMELFNELTYPELLEVAGVLKTEELEAGRIVVAEGEVSHSLYVIASGSVRVERGETPLATLERGSHFGEMALLTNRPRSANVRTLESCRLLSLDRESLYPLFEQHPAIGVKFLWRLSQIQSLRLDEATVWTRPGADTERRPPQLDGPPTQDLFPAPFSRRKS